MLIERGAKKVVSFDISEPRNECIKDNKIGIFLIIKRQTTLVPSQTHSHIPTHTYIHPHTRIYIYIRVVYVKGDLTVPADVEKACEGADCVV